MTKYKCNVCSDNHWVMMVNLYNNQQFAARCTCMAEIDKKRKPYSEFITFNPQKYQTLEEVLNVPF